MSVRISDQPYKSHCISYNPRRRISGVLVGIVPWSVFACFSSSERRFPCMPDDVVVQQLTRPSQPPSHWQGVKSQCVDTFFMLVFLGLERLNVGGGSYPMNKQSCQ